MDPEVTLYAFPPSHCSQKVRLALAEKRVGYTKRFVDIELRMQNYAPEYLRLNPRGVVPTLVHGSEVVTDSARIIRYVDAAFEGPDLTPSDDGERRAMEEWIDLQDGLAIRTLTFANLRGPLGVLLRRVSMPNRRRKLERLRAAHLDLADLYDDKLKDLMAWRSDIASPDDVQRARAEIEFALDRVEVRLTQSPHLAGPTYSLADLAWTTVFARLSMLGFASALWGRTLRPSVAAYYGRMRARESFARSGVWEGRPDAAARRELMRNMISGSGEERVEA